MKSTMDYSKAEDWILGESGFDSSHLGKCEAVMSLGNGYLGVRSATEEKYLNEKRNLFVAGTFNKFSESEVSELPNAADLLGIEMFFDGTRFDLEKGKIQSYHRQLNLKNGELKRHITWVSPEGHEISLVFSRIVSMKRLHVIAQKVEIRLLNTNAQLKVLTGIDGQVNNSGTQHFIEGEKRLFDKTYMQYIAHTTKSGIDFILNTSLRFASGSETPKSKIVMVRRKIFSEYECPVQKGVLLTLEKVSTVHTSIDMENQGLSFEEIREKSLGDIKEAYSLGYDTLAIESSEVWNETVWNNTPVTVESENSMDQLALRFAQYHLHVMTPAHDHRMSIAAKGLSGEGYKGHTFWDNEIFTLPYFTFTHSAIARSLEEYRYLSLPGAHEKAKGNGYEGAQFPWESAWLDDGEVTPVWGAADIITGLPTKIWSGFIEIHITSDVAYGAWQYYMVTNDQDFMDQFGYELILDTAKFWNARLEWSDADQKYHINEVVGPDEYKEHANDNAFTNYMAHWNIKKAIAYYELLKSEKNDIFNRLNAKMNLDTVYQQWLDKLSKIYLPQPREKDLVIPQDAAYLSLDEIDLTKYKNQEQVGSLFNDYNLEQVNKLQVTKQADVLILFFLLEDLFSLDVKKANWDYYEPRTMHDSSLSLSTHCILASDMKDTSLAYSLFERACRIDMGPNMKSSDDGIHAASIGGIWQSAIYGFGGVRMLDGKLRICPNLPKEWKSIAFYLYWHGEKLHVQADKKRIIIENLTKTIPVNVQVYDQNYDIKDRLEVTL